MEKIPTLFTRVYDNHKIVDIKNEFSSKYVEEMFNDDSCIATVKIDGACCAVIDGELYVRYDCKKGRKPPDGAIACCDPDPITGHWPHWVKATSDEQGYKWYISAYKFTKSAYPLEDGTYEAIGPHFNGNPYHLTIDSLEKHGSVIIDGVPKTFEGIKKFLKDNYIEGIVYWSTKTNKPFAKIKRTDFGFEWNGKKVK